MKKLIMTLAILAPMTTPVMADGYERGQAAYDVGDYDTAFVEWSLAAHAGDVIAQRSLGTLYCDGKGGERNDEICIFFSPS